LPLNACSSAASAEALTASCSAFRLLMAGSLADRKENYKGKLRIKKR
jgi:hypothetical protein